MGIDRRALAQTNNVYHILGHGVKDARQPPGARKLILHQISVFYTIFLSFSRVYTPEDNSLKVIRSEYRPKLAVTRHKFIKNALSCSFGSNWVLCHRSPTLLNDTSRFPPLFYLRHFWYNNLAWLRSLTTVWRSVTIWTKLSKKESHKEKNEKSDHLYLGVVGAWISRMGFGD